MKGQLSHPRGFQWELWCESAGRMATAQIRHAGSSAPSVHRPMRIKGFNACERIFTTDVFIMELRGRLTAVKTNNRSMYLFKIRLKLESDAGE